MSIKLTNTILEHIFTNLGFMDQRKNSLLSTKLLTDFKITFEDNGTESHNEVYVCETAITQAKITIAGTYFSLDDHEKDMAIVVKIENCPTYGCYLSQDKDGVHNGLLSFLLKNDAWIAANTFMQASFLAGMEQLRDIINPFNVCQDPKDIYEALISFLKYHDSLEDNEG